MKKAFTDKLHLNKANKERLNTVNDIIEEYLEEGYKLTLRQLYYQLVSRDVIANNVKEYGKLSNLLKKGRMAGCIDWEAIEDRIRIPKIPYYVADIQAAMTDTVDQYRLDRQEGQSTYIEVWVEKDALSGVLSRITHKYHVRLMVNRGYSSCTAMYDAFNRLNNNGEERVILYLGDYDPSGLDMLRDISERLYEFGLENITIIPIALTRKQIQKYKPPPNPAKLSDPRSNDYVRLHGNTSWEVDALNPKTLNQLLEKAILSLIDIELFKEKMKQERFDIEEIKSKFDME